MRVIALEMGFFGGSRRRAGEEFEYDTSKCKRNEEGDVILPKVLAPATPATRSHIADLKRQGQQKEMSAIVASAGPKRPGVVAVRPLSHGMAVQDDGSDVL